MLSSYQSDYQDPRAKAASQHPSTSRDHGPSASNSGLEQTSLIYTNPISPSGIKLDMRTPSEALAADEALAVALHHEELEAREAKQKEADNQEQDEPGSLLFPSLLEDTTSRDGLVSMRLASATSAALSPRVNSQIIRALPPPVVTDDRQRLLLRLDMYHLVEREVKGDGACQFRSLSDQLYGTPEHHDFVRKTVVQQLRDRADKYKMYVPSEYSAYCADMAKPTTWGDHVTLQAAADVYGLWISVLTSYKESCVIKIEPEQKRSGRMLWLSFWAEVHYNSVYPQEEPPPPVLHHKVLGSRRLGKFVDNLLR